MNNQMSFATLKRAARALLPYPIYDVVRVLLDLRGLQVVSSPDGLLFMLGSRGYAEMVKRGQYECDEIDAIRPHLRRGLSVLEVGAGRGVTTCYIARGVGPTGRVVAVEPDPLNRWFIRRNLGLNGLVSRVTIVKQAIGYAEYGWIYHGSALSHSLPHRRAAP